MFVPVSGWVADGLTRARGADRLFNVSVLNRASTSGLIGRFGRGVGGCLPRRTSHPLGPVVYAERAGSPLRARLLAGLVLFGCSGVFGVAAVLTPDPAGLGSHEQLGLRPCGVVALTGYPCPTCGMTTAFAHAVRGELFGALAAQPAGLVLVVLLMTVAALAAHTVLTGRSWTVNWWRVSPVWIPSMLVGLIVAGWVYKLVAGVATGRLPFHAF